MIRSVWVSLSHQTSGKSLFFFGGGGGGGGIKMEWLAHARPYSVVITAAMNCNLGMGLLFITIF